MQSERINIQLNYFILLSPQSFHKVLSLKGSVNV